MRRFSLAVTVCPALVLICSSAIAQPDISFGSNARASAMGGAGIAIVDRSERNTLINPAALALYNRRTKVAYPGVNIHISGVDAGTAFDHLFGNPDKNDAVDLARDFAKRQSDFGVALRWGIRFGHMDLNATGIAQVHVIPNGPLMNWAKTANGDVTQLPGDARGDITGAAIYALPVIGVAERVSPAGSPTRIEAGARIKLMRAFYSHYIVNRNNIVNNTAAQTAPEMNGHSEIHKDGIGVDFGMLAHPAHHNGLSGALVVTDLVEPRFTFIGTDFTPMANPVKYDLQPRSVTLGSAYEMGRWLFAADAIDLTRAYSNVRGCLGAEYTTGKISLRAGYNSATGFAAGFGWGWLQLAFGTRAPLEIASTLRF